MTAIPDDVMKAAEEAVGKHLDRRTAMARKFAIVVARAIMAERERCAKVAEAMPWQIDISPAHVRGLKGSDVAEAIRSGQ